MSSFTFHSGEARVVVLIDDECIVLASDENKSNKRPLTRRKKALIVALLETAIAEINDEIEVM